VTAPAPPRRLAPLDGLRGLAALSVLVYHVWLYTRPGLDRAARPELWDQLANELRLGLVLFFVLSGFLLYGPWIAAALGSGPRPGVRAYLGRRAARILPAYYVAVAGSIALLWGAAGTPGVRLPDAADLPLFLVFGQNFTEHTLLTLNAPLWTLAVEASFYLLLPVVGLLAVRAGRRRSVQALFPLLLLGAGLAWNWQLAERAGQDLSLTLTKVLPAMLPYFAVGMLAALLVSGRRIGRPVAWALLVGGLACVGLDAWWHSAGAATGSHDLKLRIWRDLPAAAGFAALLAVAARGGVADRVLGSRPLAGLGTVSYGLYLWHVPAILFLARLGILPGADLFALAVVLPLSLAVATASWRWVERPVLERARGRDRAARERVEREPERDRAAGRPALGHAGG
jgi:peptidoglycan/LPS O-acetylase OafA/YrhL